MWPDPATRDALAATARDLRAACGGRAPPAANIHLTLAFLGAVAPSRLPAITAVAAGLKADAFALSLDLCGYWRAQRLVWAGPRVCPPPLAALAGGLNEALRERGFRVERRTFKPHVTLLRDVAAAPPQSGLGPLNWPVRRFVLACSEPAARGVSYRTVGEWSLQAPGL